MTPHRLGQRELSIYILKVTVCMCMCLWVCPCSCRFGILKKTQPVLAASRGKSKTKKQSVLIMTAARVRAKIKLVYHISITQVLFLETSE